MSENKKRNRMYQVYELRDSLEEAIENIKKVMEQDGLLVECILNHPNKDKLVQITKSLMDETKNFAKKIENYNERLQKTKYLISLYEAKDEKSQTVIDVISRLLEAMALDKPEDPVYKA